MLNCHSCINLIRGMEDEGPAGGGCDNVARCAARPEVEDAVRNELKAYGSTGNPFSTWMVAQVGFDESCIPASDEQAGDDPVSTYVDDDGDPVAVYRDPAWQAWDNWIETLPRMEIRVDLCRVRDHLGQEAISASGRRYKPIPVTSYIRPDGDNEWLLRREQDIIEDCLWRAQRGRCSHYSRRPEQDDVVLQSFWLDSINAHGMETDEPDEWKEVSDERIDAEWRMIREAEWTESILSGQWSTATPSAVFAV